MGTENDLFNPFVGLRAFEEEEDYLFFGRTAEINDLLKKFGGSPFLAVIGSSGSGKSSLVKSGLLPAIHSGFLSPGHNWHVALMRPGDKPISNLAEALAKKGVLYDAEKTIDGIPYQPIIESSLRRSNNGLIQVYRQSPIFSKEKANKNKPQTENLLIIVDQFEELFRFSSYEKEKSQGESQASNFVKLLLSATEDQKTEEAEKIPVYVLLTMRSDFLGDCSEFRGLPEAINKGQYLVPRMTRDEIKEAITGPIAVGGTNIEGGAKITQRLLTRVLNDVGTDIDQLPMMQHAMMRTWQHWAKRTKAVELKNDELNKTLELKNEDLKNLVESKDIDIVDYDEIGGMKKALSVHADEIYKELKKEDHVYCEQIFKALTDKTADVRGTRRPRKIKVLKALTKAPVENIKEIADAFRKPGRTFLMPPITTGLDEETTIDISHESLMRVWDLLKGWTEQEAQDAETFKRLAEAARRHEMKEVGFYDDPELKHALEWRAKFENDENLIKTWAKSFEKDNAEKVTDLALNFLKKSNEDFIAKKEEKERLKREKREKEEELAAAKRQAIEDEKERQRQKIEDEKERQRAEEEKERLRKEEEARKERQRKEEEERKKRKRLLGVVIALGVVAVVVGFLAYKAYVAAEKATAALLIAEAAKERAQKSDSLAQNEKAEALHQKNLAKKAELVATDSAIAALKSQISAIWSERDALYQKGLAEEQKDIAEKQKLISDSLAKKSAAAQYQKLIRNFITNEDVIKKDTSLPYKLVAYSNHLGILKDTFGVKGAELIDYETYDKLYFCLKSRGNKYCPVQPGNDANKKFVTDTSAKVKEIINANPLGTIVAFTEDETDKIVIYSTVENDLYVHTENSQEDLRIPMGSQVTAIGYYPEKNIIYFGLKTGDIGYIKYTTDGKNQPVYGNRLYSKITAGNFFIKDNNYYFLTTSYMGNAVVYNLGSDNSYTESLVPNKRLKGIELQDYQGVIYSAKYDSKIDRIILVTAKGTFKWNPFTGELLTQLKDLLNPKGLMSTQQQPDCKFY